MREIAGWRCMARELKLDGFRAIAFKIGGKIHLRSRNDKDFNGCYRSACMGCRSPGAALPEQV